MSQSDQQKHICVLCNSKLDSKEALQEHFRKHANKEIDSKGRPWKSASCSSRNNRQATVSRISKNSSKPGDIVCDVCGQDFESVTVAIQHKFRKHPESAAKHFCPYCGMQFPLKINRDKHLLDHPSGTPSKFFPCADCGVVFYNEDAQAYHTKSTHKRIVALFKPVATPPPSKKIKVNNAGEAQSVYYCHLCGFEYIVKFNLQKHLERQHAEQERNQVPEDLIKCTTCDALFYNKRAYDNHNMYHKPEDLYVTSEEQRLQTVSRVDQDFDIRRVQTVAEKFIPVYRPRPPSQKKYGLDSHLKTEGVQGVTYPQMKKEVEAGKDHPGVGRTGADVTRKKGRAQKATKDDSSEELSPNSSAESSESDSDIPLIERLDSKRRNVVLQ